MFYPHSVLVCSMWTLEQTVLVSPYGINRLIQAYIKKKVCAYCAVRTAPLNLILVTFSFLGRNMSQVVSRWALTAEARVRFQVSLCQMCWITWHWGTVSPQYFGLPPWVLHTHLHLHVALTRRTTGYPVQNLDMRTRKGSTLRRTDLPTVSRNKTLIVDFIFTTS